MSVDETDDTLHKEGMFISVVADKRQDIDSSKQVIKEIIQKKPFINIQQERIWSFEKDEESAQETDIPWLNSLMNFMAILIEAILWILLPLILFYFYHYRAVWLRVLSAKSRVKPQTDIPHTLFGLDLRQQSLPEDVEVVALKLWQENNYRDAVSLLYRASLSALFKRYEFNLNAGATELDCIQQIEGSKSAEKIAGQIDSFKKITDMWMSLAYAHQLPSEQYFKEQCQAWNKTYLNDGMVK